MVDVWRFASFHCFVFEGVTGTYIEVSTDFDGGFEYWDQAGAVGVDWAGFRSFVAEWVCANSAYRLVVRLLSSCPYFYLYFKFSRVAVAQPLHLVVLRFSRVFLASN